MTFPLLRPLKSRRDRDNSARIYSLWDKHRPVSLLCASCRGGPSGRIFLVRDPAYSGVATPHRNTHEWDALFTTLRMSIYPKMAMESIIDVVYRLAVTRVKGKFF